MSRDCRVALPRGAMGLSAVCDFGISRSYSLSIFGIRLDEAFMTVYIVCVILQFSFLQ